MAGSPWGGSEILWAATARAALEDGHEVAIVTKRWPETPGTLLDLESRGARLFLRDVDLASRSSRAYERIAGPLRALVRWGPEVVLISQGGVLELMFRGDVDRLLRTLGVPYAVLGQHNTDRLTPGINDHARRRTVAYFEKAVWVGFVADENLRTARRQLLSHLTNARVVLNPVNLPTLDAIPMPRPGGPWRLACVARLEVDFKGQDLLLEALGGPAWRDRDWRLRLYGKGPSQAYLEELARFSGITDRVEFKGHVDDIGDLWADNHLLVLPSRSEGTPISMVEAMTCGRPVVATDVGGNAEWVDEPRTGFLAEGVTVRSIAAALERAWAIREDWAAIGAEAHRLAVARMARDPARSLLMMLIDAATPVPAGGAA